ncbi:MAG: sigma 54-interacting transcriptional regulator [Proteobacteria bacterium]|nr:sigma 54-interacting transcriptional regulator [Pseudomonadota bacterium]MBU1418067.1 sigma 54-interacting transcriptional regulator [Pseudomonadota bacterium]MBU1454103.1 sigma 54-interacting transcriptional regulator [Pseudomonadota bacterium]
MNNTLTEHERKLFELFSRAIYDNPFTPQRRQTDCKISGLKETSPNDIILDRVINEAAEQVANLRNTGRIALASYTLETDRQLARNLFLFHVFHRYSGSLDKHIMEQSANKTSLVPMQEANDALQLLDSYGFSPADALHYFALFFQMRRAYFFIHHGLIGCSPSIQELRAQLWNNIFTHDINRYAHGLWQRMEDFSTLLLGETGTGKSLAAAAIGRSGFIPFSSKTSTFYENFTTAFVSRNLSQFSSQLIESELFGHNKGAFTGALYAHKGIFAVCSPYGAIFLDEIGDADIPIQIKLLRVLQDRTFSPVGSQDEQRFSGRVIAATNRPLDEMRKQGTFRNDFYFRLSSDRIHIPPLRRRIEEDPRELKLLLDVLVRKITGYEDAELSIRIQKVIEQEMGRNYPWLGNVRELEQCIRQILLNNRCSSASTYKNTNLQGQQLHQTIEAGTYNVTELTAYYCNMLYRKHGTYQAVARVTGLDRRTVKKYLDISEESGDQ